MKLCKRHLCRCHQKLCWRKRIYLFRLVFSKREKILLLFGWKTQVVAVDFMMIPGGKSENGKRYDSLRG